MTTMTYPKTAAGGGDTRGAADRSMIYLHAP